jgi:hypothetical protein
VLAARAQCVFIQPMRGTHSGEGFIDPSIAPTNCAEEKKDGYRLSAPLRCYQLRSSICFLDLEMTAMELLVALDRNSALKLFPIW